MEARGRRDLGLSIAAAGLVVIVLAVLLFGLTTASGALDRVGIITAVGGVALAGVGLYLAFHHKGTGPAPTRRHLHTASWAGGGPGGSHPLDRGTSANTHAPEHRYPESSLGVKSRRRP